MIKGIGRQPMVYDVKPYATEERMQADCFKWFDNEFPEERRMLHCNNNNSSNKLEGNKAKAVGVIRGVADLELVCWGGRTIYIELKLPNKTQSEEQIDFMDKVRARGHMYIIIYSFEDFKLFIKSVYGKAVGNG